MKRIAALLLALGLLLGISGFTAGAANEAGTELLLREEVLYNPDTVSESGEISVGWVPESLDPETAGQISEETIPESWELPVMESASTTSEESTTEETMTVEEPTMEKSTTEEMITEEATTEEMPTVGEETATEEELITEEVYTIDDDAAEEETSENEETTTSEEEKTTTEEEPESEPEPKGDTYDTTDSYTLAVRNQGDRETCWAMAAIACAEYYALGHGYADTDPDYSEWALSYFSKVGFRDNRGNAGLDTHDYNTFEVFSSGNIHRSTMSLACWLGPVSESVSSTAYSRISSNRNPETVYARNYDAMHLENAYWLTATTETDRSVLKQAIREYGAAILCMYYVGSYCNQTKDEDGTHYSYFKPDVVCDDTSGNIKTNHEVTVVGWDDDYPASYFKDTPPGNGAWKCRNSYGNTWGENGYFWVSYYDATALQSAWAVFEYGSADNYDLNYQYDCCTVVSSVDFHQSLGDKEDVDLDTYANVFTAGSEETLQAVATYTYNPGVSYTLRIYTGLNGTTPSAGGTVALTQEGTFDYAGFHTVVLDQEVKLEKGEHFSVIFTVGDDTAGGRLVPTCSTQTADKSWHSINFAESGQSFYSTYNCAKTNKYAWADFSKSGSNFRIKAYTSCEEHEEHYVEDLCEICSAYGYLNGDCDGDGERNVLDLLALMRYQLGERDQVYASADLTGDGSSTVADLVCLLRGLCGLKNLGVTS